jgi:hypothetical protein
MGKCKGCQKEEANLRRVPFDEIISGGARELCESCRSVVCERCGDSSCELKVYLGFQKNPNLSSLLCERCSHRARVII